MLFCITANYTPKALDAMGKNPNTNRREAVEKLVNAAGGKLVAMYGTIAEGPGAMVTRPSPLWHPPWPPLQHHLMVLQTSDCSVCYLGTKCVLPDRKVESSRIPTGRPVNKFLSGRLASRPVLSLLMTYRRL